MWSSRAAVALALALALPGAAAAIDYPPPEDPGELPPPPPDGGEATLRVCGKPRCFQSIQEAVNAAGSGDTIRVANGRYRESVQISGAGRLGLHIVGNPRRPGRVVLNGRRLSGARAQNGFLVDGVDDVAIRGFRVKRYRGNGVLVTGATGVTLSRLEVRRTGANGIYVFDSRGGRVTHSTVAGAAGAGIHIGQTRVQVKPRRTFVKRVRASGNATGFAGSNARHVTLHRSEFTANGVGIALQAVDSDRFPPSELNVIRRNEVAGNDRIGILMAGGRDNVVEANAIHGNGLAGLAMIDAFWLDAQGARTLDRNVVRGNTFGPDGNGHDIAYDGSGSGNCFADNPGTQRNLPADNSELVACPFDGPNGVNADARRRMLALGG